MKRILCLILASVMVIACLPFAAGAAPENYCLKFDDSGAYVQFNDGVAVSPSQGGSVSFDLALASASNGDPVLKLNGDGIQISLNSIIINGKTTSFNWGSAEIIHWRKVEFTFSGNTITAYVDGNEAATGSGTYSLNLLYFIGYPGEIYIDNLKVVSGGQEVVSLDFDNVTTFNSYLNTMTISRTQVPQGSYYDYEEIPTPENVSYIFNNQTNCSKLSVQSGVEMKRGDINEDNKLNTRDLSLLKRILTNDNTVTFKEVLADVNGDGKINSKDTARIKKLLTGDAEVLFVTISAGSGSAVYNADMQSALLTAEDATAEGIDANLIMDAPIDPDDYPYAVITYMTPNKSDDHNSAVAVKSAFGAWGNFKEYNLTNDGRFHSEIVDLADVSTWNGDAATLKFFTAANIGDKIFIDSIIFCGNLSKANAAKTEREGVKSSFKMIDEETPDPTGKIGALDEFNNYVVRFDSSEKISAKVSPVNNTRVTFADNSIRAVALAGADPSFYVDLVDEQISAGTYKYIAYIYKNPSSNASSKGANIYYVVNDINEPTGGYETEVGAGVKGDRYNSYTFDLTGKSNWSGAIKGLRIDYFTDCSTNDNSFIDSIIFGQNTSTLNKAVSARLRDRNGVQADDTAQVWNTYWSYYKNANNYEFISGSDTDLTMYFRYSTNSAKLTARSLGDRMARAITEATGFEVTCTVYGLCFAQLMDTWGQSEPQANIYYTLKYEGVSYVVCVRTVIIKDGNYSDELDGTSSDPSVYYYNLSNYYSTPGYSVSDTHDMGTYSTYLAYHSNHESKMVETPYGAFAVYHTSGNPDNGNHYGGGQFSVFRIFDNGSFKKIATYSCTAHSTKPYIHYGDDGLVYFIEADDEENMSTCAISLGYFDPSQPNSDGTYNITYSRETKAYPGGAAWSGYGYSSSVIDPSQGKIYIVYNGGGGNRGYYLCWFVYNYRNHTWGTSQNVILTQTHRHCYTYLFPDGNGGMYIVGERDVLLADIGLAGICTGADYAWDEINMIHIPNVNSTAYTFQNVFSADYTQTGRELYPGYMNSYSECYVDSNSNLHVFWTKAMHGRDIRDGRSVEMWHAVYDVAGAKRPELISKEPISFTSANNCYSIRFCENTKGELFIIAIPTENPKCEIWKATDENGTQFELKHVKQIGMGPATAFIAGTKRTNSVVDNTVTCAMPVGSDSGKYYSFVVTLPSD